MPQLMIEFENDAHLRREIIGILGAIENGTFGVNVMQAAEPENAESPVPTIEDFRLIARTHVGSDLAEALQRKPKGISLGQWFYLLVSEGNVEARIVEDGVGRLGRQLRVDAKDSGVSLGAQGRDGLPTASVLDTYVKHGFAGVKKVAAQLEGISYNVISAADWRNIERSLLG